MRRSLGSTGANSGTQVCSMPECPKCFMYSRIDADSLHITVLGPHWHLACKQAPPNQKPRRATTTTHSAAATRRLSLCSLTLPIMQMQQQQRVEALRMAQLHKEEEMEELNLVPQCPQRLAAIQVRAQHRYHLQRIDSKRSQKRRSARFSTRCAQQVPSRCSSAPTLARQAVARRCMQRCKSNSVSACE